MSELTKDEAIHKVIECAEYLQKHTKGPKFWTASQDRLMELFDLSRDDIAVLKWRNRKWHRENPGAVLVELFK